ncbi:DUF7096 domain-containing protein [Natrinema longum]|uniref:Uncharacterized protein n=1 Tax=Natrinema longum TaxID=370324 RepID=A0A8A2UDZ2_9EURY|nr:hypothetical protein [Natrinema longum]MBZ6495579.1 hypothetical protein [Natrinema longum]QSW86959.1 hypothetical protein J0X27_06470 [Natrinema longum]
MNNAMPALLAFLLVLSLPAMTVVAAAPDGERVDGSAAALQQELPYETAPVEAENTTNRLPLTGDVRSEHTDYGSGLGLVFASADDELRLDHEQYTLVDDEFDDATTEQQAAMVQQAYERINERADELEQREREAVRAYAAGEQSTNELLQTLLRNHKEAAMLADTLRDLEGHASRVSGYSLPADYSDYKALEYHRTPLRENLEALTDRPTRGSGLGVTVSASQTGYSLGMMDGDQYLVETARFDNRDGTDSERLQHSDAYDYTGELYPWATEDGPHFQDNSPDHYWAETGHDQGRLDFYFNSQTGNVYRETQELTAQSLPVTEETTGSSDGLELSINETPPAENVNSPIEVTVTDQATGEPEQATIIIDGIEIGKTDEDGSLWIVPTIGQSELTARTANGTVNATITS